MATHGKEGSRRNHYRTTTVALFVIETRQGAAASGAFFPHTGSRQLRQGNIGAHPGRSPTEKSLKYVPDACWGAGRLPLNNTIQPTRGDDMGNRTRLADLASQINAEHVAVGKALRSGLEDARRAGEALLEAMKLAPRGQRLPWLAANTTVSERTAQAYMQVARRYSEFIAGNPQRVADLSFREGLKLLSEPIETDTPMEAAPTTTEPEELPDDAEYEELERELAVLWH
jgi:hypothetical protein